VSPVKPKLIVLPARLLQGASCTTSIPKLQLLFDTSHLDRSAFCFLRDRKKIALLYSKSQYLFQGLFSLNSGEYCRQSWVHTVVPTRAFLGAVQFHTTPAMIDIIWGPVTLSLHVRILGNLNTPFAGSRSTPARGLSTVKIFMSSLSASSFRLLEAFKSSLRPGQFLQTVQDHGIILIGVIFGLIVLYAARYITSPYRKVPPGPRGYPIIGNLLEMSGGLAGQWLKYAGWHKKYGQFVASSSLFANF
jgi:hypothetical protein